MKRKLKMRDKILTGDAGQYFVAGELSRRGYIAALTVANTPHFDILVSKADGSNQKAIQVKTSTGKEKTWILSSRGENLFNPNIIYVFVILNELNQPIYHIVPSSIVAEQIKTSHQEWLSGTKKDGSERKDSTMRKFCDYENKYLDRWDLLD